MQNPPQELSRQELWRGKEQMKTQSAEKSKGETEKKKKKFDTSSGFYCGETDKYHSASKLFSKFH